MPLEGRAPLEWERCAVNGLCPEVPSFCWWGDDVGSGLLELRCGSAAIDLGFMALATELDRARFDFPGRDEDPEEEEEEGGEEGGEEGEEGGRDLFCCCCCD